MWKTITGLRWVSGKYYLKIIINGHIMKRFINIIAVGLMLTACQSTSPRIITNEQNKEQKLNRNIDFLQGEILSGKQEKKI